MNSEIETLIQQIKADYSRFMAPDTDIKKEMNEQFYLLSLLKRVANIPKF